jgi:hypothetical protein
LGKKAEDLTAARRILEGFEAEALAGVARLLADTAESLARTIEAMKIAQPAEWMDHDQAAAYLNRTPGAFKELVRTEGVPRHHLSERGILYNRAELDAWLMDR